MVDHMINFYPLPRVRLPAKTGPSIFKVDEMIHFPYINIVQGSSSLTSKPSSILPVVWASSLYHHLPAQQAIHLFGHGINLAHECNQQDVCLTIRTAFYASYPRDWPQPVLSTGEFRFR
jgi:hypothetical protein